MSIPNATPEHSSSRAGVEAVLRYSGIPRSWLKRPKLPSRNWLIFLGSASSLLSLYVYDRYKCKEIRQSYVDRVRHLAEQPLQPLDMPRKVTVYGSKWPGDDDYNQSIKYFKKYVKPVLVAAAVDYDIVNGQRHGDLTEYIAETIKRNRRIDAGLETEALPLSPLIKQPTPEEKLRRKLEGGSIIVGRPTFKEFMAGLKRGWSESLEKIDKEEALSHELEGDTHFDELEEERLLDDDASDEPIPTTSRLVPSEDSVILSNLSPPFGIPTQKPKAVPLPWPGSADIPPSSIPPYPPLLLVSFTNHVGLAQIPIMIYEFFNQRAKVRAGSAAAYRLIKAYHRPIEVPQMALEASSTISPGDLDFDREAEAYYKRSVYKLPTDIEKARADYYKELPKRLEIARGIARGTREPTKDEKGFPPLTEVELREERMKKEMRWRGDLTGWEIIKPDASVVWDERFRDVLHIYIDKDETESL